MNSVAFQRFDLTFLLGNFILPPGIPLRNGTPSRSTPATPTHELPLN
jgi:hypothetical protein